MVRFVRLLSHYRRPHLADFFALLFSVASIASAGVITPCTFNDVATPTLFVLIGLSIATAAFAPLLTVLGRKVESGFAWSTPFGILCMLAAVFVHPVGVFPVIAVSVITLHTTHQQTNFTWPIGLAGFVVPYTTAGILVKLLTTADTGLGVWVVVFTLGVAIAEVMNWWIVFPLSAMVHGEIRVPQINLKTIKPIAVLSVLTVLVGISCYTYDIFIASMLLVTMTVIAFIYDQAIRNHQNFLGARSLSWGVTTTALNFMEKLDDRTYRHSLSSARYTRDALRKWGFPKAVQDLGFMAGLLHQAGLAGVAKRLRIAEEEFIRDDLPPVPLPGEKTFDWNDLRIVDQDDPMQQVIADAQHAAANASGEKIAETSENEVFSSAGGDVEPAWWRPQEGKCFLSPQDIMTLDLHPAQTALLLEGASLYGGLPDIIEQHKKDSGDQKYVHQDPRVACAIANMLKIAVKYEALTAIDGSFPQKTPDEAITMLKECEEELDPKALAVFLEMMSERPESYRNGTDLDYENPNEQLIETFATDVPGPFDVKGWERYGKILQQKTDNEKAFVMQFAKDYLNHTAKQREQENSRNQTE